MRILASVLVVLSLIVVTVPAQARPCAGGSCGAGVSDQAYYQAAPAPAMSYAYQATYQVQSTYEPAPAPPLVSIPYPLEYGRPIWHGPPPGPAYGLEYRETSRAKARRGLFGRERVRERVRERSVKRSY